MPQSAQDTKAIATKFLFSGGANTSKEALIMCKLFSKKEINLGSIQRNIRKQTQLKYDRLYGPSS